MTALFVSVAVSPLVVTSPVRFGLVTVPALPVTDPVMGAVTVKAASVPTDVRLDARTFAASVAPVSVPAAAAPPPPPAAPTSMTTPLVFFKNSLPSKAFIAISPTTSAPAVGTTPVTVLRLCRYDTRNYPRLQEGLQDWNRSHRWRWRQRNTLVREGPDLTDPSKELQEPPHHAAHRLDLRQ